MRLWNEVVRGDGRGRKLQTPHWGLSQQTQWTGACWRRGRSSPRSSDAEAEQGDCHPRQQGLWGCIHAAPRTTWNISERGTTRVAAPHTQPTLAASHRADRPLALSNPPLKESAMEAPR